MIPQATNDNISNKTVCTITIGKHACKYIYCVNHGAIFANKYCVKHTRPIMAQRSKIKLFFRGKLYTCGGCGTKHTYTEGCPTSQHDQKQNCPTSQDNQQPIPERNITTQQTRDSTNTQQNSDNTENTNDVQQKPTATQSGRNRTHSRIPKHTSTKQQPNKTTEDKNNRGMENNITGTPVNSQEVDFPQSPCIVS